MFEKIKNFWRDMRSMFSKADIKRIVGCDVDLTREMVDAVELWLSMINGTAPWNNRAPSQGIPDGICREFADIVINEMEAIIVDNDQLNKLFQDTIKDLNENLQDALALGSMIIKPMMGGKVEYVTAKDFIPVKFDNNKLIDCILIERKKRGDRYFFRTERHQLTDQGLRIENKAYYSTASSLLGTQIPLADVPEWADYPEEINYPGMIKMDFGFYKNPLKNKIDSTACGVSIYSGSAEELIRKADIQAARYDWEFESGERAIHVDERALIYERNTGNMAMPKLDRRLYRGLNIDAGTGELLKEYSPEMRDESFNRGFENYLRRIEFAVGLAYGDLSNTQYVEKTATEIKVAKQRKYNRVTAIQENLRTCLEELVDAIAFYNAMFTTGYTFTCNFNDSILTDEEAEREQDRQDVAMGTMRLEEYRAKWYGEDIETAKKNLPPQNDTILDNLNLR